MILTSKWGFDGATGQSIYKQKNQEHKTSEESAVFMTSLAPLKLYIENNETYLGKSNTFFHSLLHTC